MSAYKTTLTKAELIDAITNLIDDGIRKSRYETYDEWQAAVEKLLTTVAVQRPKAGLMDRPDLGTGGILP